MTEDRFFNLNSARSAAMADTAEVLGLTILLDWIHTYLMASHADLGRTGAVCPYTKQAAKLDCVRVTVSRAGPQDENDTFAIVRSAFHALNAIPCKASIAHFRTVIIGFPNCADDAGIAMLRRVQRRQRGYSLIRGRMIGLMHPTSEDQGLWNRDFRPLRAPIPVLAVRHMVEQDAPFAALHRALFLAYLVRFPIKGPRKLLKHWRARNG